MYLHYLLLFRDSFASHKCTTICTTLAFCGAKRVQTSAWFLAAWWKMLNVHVSVVWCNAVVQACGASVANACVSVSRLAL